MAITHTVTLNVDKDKIRLDQRVHVRTGDVSSQVVVCNMQYGGSAYTPASGSTAKLEILKPDGTWTVTSASISGSTVRGTIPAAAMTAPGECKRAYFRIINGSAEDTTEDFYLYVYPNATQDAIESASYSDQLDALIRASESELESMLDSVFTVRDTMTGASNTFDLNDYETNGAHRMESTPTYTNAPEEVAASGGELVVFKTKFRTVAQMAFATSGTVYKRFRFGGTTWTPWQTVADGSAIEELREVVSGVMREASPIQWMDWSSYTETWSYLRQNRKVAVAVWAADKGTRVSLLDSSRYTYTLRVYSFDNKTGMARWAVAKNANGEAAQYLQYQSATTDGTTVEHDGYAVLMLNYTGSAEAIPTGYESKVSITSSLGTPMFSEILDGARFDTVPLTDLALWDTSATLKKNRAKTRPVAVSKNDCVVNHTIYTQRMQVFSTMDAALAAYNSTGYVTGDVYAETAFVDSTTASVPDSGYLLLDLQGWSNSGLPSTADTGAYLSVQHMKLGTSECGTDEISYPFIDRKSPQITNLQMHDITLSGNTAADITTIAHITDPHADTSHVTVTRWLLDNMGDFVDYAVCTGDQCQTYYGDGFAFWGSENPIPVVMGNHDTLTSSASPRDYEDTISQEQLYQTFFAPYLQYTGISMTANTTWWSKDVGKLRILGINTEMHERKDSASITAQQTWFVQQLESARTSGLAVLVAMHRTPNAGAINLWKDSNWCSTKFTDSPGIVYFEGHDDIIAAVDDFIDAGGVFTCYLCGHQHHDSIGNIKDTRNDQPFVTGNCAYTNSGVITDVLRPRGVDAQYSINLVSCNCKNGEVRVLKLGADRPYEGYSRNFIRFKGNQIMEQN